MDTSEEYQKMCKKSEDIQKNMCIPFVKNPYGYKDDILIHGDCFLAYYEGTTVYLPRQDQLQEMVFSPNGSIIAWITSFWNFARDEEDGKTKDKIMEQLWLAFVMKEKYNKTWNGKDWKEHEKN